MYAVVPRIRDRRDAVHRLLLDAVREVDKAVEVARPERRPPTALSKRNDLLPHRSLDGVLVLREVRIPPVPEEDQGGLARRR